MWKIGFTLSLHSEIKDLQRILKILKAPILDNKTSFSSIPKINWPILIMIAEIH